LDAFLRNRFLLVEFFCECCVFLGFRAHFLTFGIVDLKVEFLIGKIFS
jgi:hypothetical protein